MTSWFLSREGEGWRLPLADRQVSRCIVDYAFTMEFYDDAEGGFLRIAGQFTITDREGQHVLDPEIPVKLGPAIALFGAQVRSARASDAGRLEMIFADQRALSVEPDAHYEAWEIVGPSGVLAVCMPGGSLATWDP